MLQHNNSPTASVPVGVSNGKIPRLFAYMQHERWGNSKVYLSTLLRNSWMRA